MVPSGTMSRRRVRKSGTRVPSSELTNTCSVTKAAGSHASVGRPTSRTAPSAIDTERTVAGAVNVIQVRNRSSSIRRPAISTTLPIPGNATSIT